MTKLQVLYNFNLITNTDRHSNFGCLPVFILSLLFLKQIQCHYGLSTIHRYIYELHLQCFEDQYREAWYFSLLFETNCFYIQNTVKAIFYSYALLFCFLIFYLCNKSYRLYYIIIYVFIYFQIWQTRYEILFFHICQFSYAFPV